MSQYKGVTLFRQHRTRNDGTQKTYWWARIQVAGKRLHIGYYDSQRKAAEAYDVCAMRLHGDPERLNFPERAGKFKNPSVPNRVLKQIDELTQK